MLTEMQRQFVEVAARTIHQQRAPQDQTWVWTRDDRDRAVYLLGRLEGENRATIEEVIIAAAVTDDLETEGATVVDQDALFRAIALEALTGEGKVREEFGEIVLVRGSAPDPKRCETCGWPLAESTVDGCVPGNCSLRPRPSKTYVDRCSSTRPLVIPRRAPADQERSHDR